MRRPIAGVALAAGLSLASAATGYADPSATPVTPTTPAPTVAVQGGVQAPATGTSAAGTSAAGTSAAGTTGSAAQIPAAGADVLDQLADEYAVGAGGGQVSNLLKAALKLKAMGFRPSKANLQEITAAMDYRPNQMPLIAALKDTIAYQQKLKAQMEILQQYQQAQAGNAVLGGSTYSAPSMGSPSGGQPGMSVGTAPAPADAGAPMMPAAPTP